MVKQAAAPDRPDSREGDGPAEGAYDTIALREFWGLLSLGFFVLSLATRPLSRVLPDEGGWWSDLPPDPLLAVLLVPILSLLGLGSAILTDRRRSATGRLGFWLNLCVLGLILTFGVLVIAWWTLR